MWIIDNADLGSGNGTSELARFLAKCCVLFASATLFSWVFDKVVVKWTEYGKSSGQ